MSGLPVEKSDAGVLLRVRLSPKAACNAVTGLHQDSNGRACLKISVTAVPEKGKANKALIRYLSKEWKLPKSAFEIVGGATDRDKSIHIDVAFDEIMECLAPFCGE